MEGSTQAVAASTATEVTSSNGNGQDSAVEKQAPAQTAAKPVVAPKKEETVKVEPREVVDINLHSLLKAGVHFGHQTSRWHPKMGKYIHTTRNGIHIISLPKTLQCWEKARKVIVDVAASGGNVMFVGTKKQAQSSIMEEATRCGSFYVAQRWLGGMITNFRTIRNSIERLKKLEALLVDNEQRAKYTKKELLMMDREREKLHFSLSGIKDMYGAPKLMFVVDTKREHIAVSEARKLDIPVVAMVDTNSDPSAIDHAIPANDDSTRSIKIFCQAVADAVAEGKAIHADRARRIKNNAEESKEEKKEAADGAA